MAFCLPTPVVNDFLERIKSGEINPEKMSEMTSAERNTFFSSFLGEPTAKQVNALFESKLLLKNQQRGIVNWAKQVANLKPEVKRDFISRVEKMDAVLQPKDMDSFLADLAEKKLGFGVTMEEATKISDLSKLVAEKKGLIQESTVENDGSQEKMDYGLALVAFDKYVGALKSESKRLTPKEFMLSPLAWVDAAGSFTKSIATTLDDSFYGRQGGVTLATNPDIWVKDFLQSWKRIGKQLVAKGPWWGSGDDAVMDNIKAYVWSSHNALNGKFEAQGFDIGLSSEEEIPSLAPEGIPLLGRLFKASNIAFNGAALMLRKKLGDRLLAQAEEFGVNVMDKSANIGKLVNSMTGRGALKMTPGQSRFTNVVLFSIRWIKSQIDVLTAHGTFGRKLFSKKPEDFADKKAAENLLKVISSVASILTIAKLLDPDSVELDPRSSNFGKIMVGDRHEHSLNVSFGMNSIITLAARATPSFHNGELAFWTKNSKGRHTKLGTGEYGVRNVLDVMLNFATNKAAPIARVLVNIYTGKTFEGDKPTVVGELKESVTPIAIGNVFELARGSAGAKPLMYAILSALDIVGVAVNTKQRRKRR